MGRDLRFKARREVILAGSTFNSSQLLELSGVGRRKALKSLRRIAEAASLAKWLINEERPGPKGASDEGLADHLRASDATPRVAHISKEGR